MDGLDPLNKQPRKYAHNLRNSSTILHSLISVAGMRETVADCFLHAAIFRQVF